MVVHSLRKYVSDDFKFFGIYNLNVCKNVTLGPTPLSGTVVYNLFLQYCRDTDGIAVECCYISRKGRTLLTFRKQFELLLFSCVCRGSKCLFLFCYFILFHSRNLFINMPLYTLLFSWNCILVLLKMKQNRSSHMKICTKKPDILDL